MSEEWGPWIEHDGRGCPCVGMFVELVALCVCLGELPPRRGTPLATSTLMSWDWANHPKYTAVLRYRIRKPRGMVVLEGQLADLREGVEA